MCGCITCNCCQPCCKFSDYIRNYNSDHESKTKDRDPESVVIFETTLTKTAQYISYKSAWLTAGILAIACQAIIKDYSTVLGSWIYLSILLFAAIIYATFPQRLIVDDYKQIAHNLDIQVNRPITNSNDNLRSETGSSVKSPTIGDYLNLSKNKPHLANKKDVILSINNQSEGDENVSTPLLPHSANISSETGVHDHGKYYDRMKRLVNSTFIEANVLLINMNILIMATLANVIALALSNAISVTVGEYGSSTWLVTTDWITAVLVTVVSIGVISQLAIKLVGDETKLIDHIKRHGIDESKDEILIYQLRFEFCIYIQLLFR